MEFVSIAWKTKILVTLTILIAKTLLIKESMLWTKSNEAKTKELGRFTASHGWVVGFVKRHGLRSIALYGKVGSIKTAQAVVCIKEIREKLWEYTPTEIDNVYGTGLLFKLLLRRTYILKQEDVRSLWDVKAMSAQDIVIGYVCINADGSDKLDIVIIKNFKNPRSFTLVHPQFHIFLKKKCVFGYINISVVVFLCVPSCSTQKNVKKSCIVNG